jgi:hypothetical protein
MVQGPDPLVHPSYIHKELHLYERGLDSYGEELVSSRKINYPATVEEKMLVVQQGNGISLRAVTSCELL